MVLLALLLGAASCETLEEDVPTAAFVSWPELEWRDVPPEHRVHLSAMIEALDSALAMEARHVRATGYYTADLGLAYPPGPPEGVTVYSHAGRGYVELAAFHVDAPGSGCIVRLGLRSRQRYEDVEGLVETKYRNGMRLPDQPGVIECMQTRPASELRPRITRHDL